MSVGQAREKVGERQATESKDGRRSYRRVYTVECTSRDDGANAVLSAVGLPGRGYVYSAGSETNYNSRVVTRSPRQVGPTVWEVEVAYEEPDPSTATTSEGQPTSNPLDYRTIVSCEFESFSRVLDSPSGGETWRNASGTQIYAIANSARMPFDPAYVLDYYRPVLTITRNQEWFDWEYAAQFVGAVNSADWFGQATRRWRCLGITTPGQQWQRWEDLDIFYYPVTYRFAYKREMWDLFLLDQGPFYYAGGIATASSTNKTNFTDKHGNLCQGNLDTNGDTNGTSEARYLQFRVLHEIDFHQLNLPQAFPYGANFY